MELAALLDGAQTASRLHRIDWRDRIAVHGAAAIEAVRPWLRDPVLAAFAIRVIERVGATGEAELAQQVLREARPDMPVAVKPDVAWALKRLRAATDAGAPTSKSLGERRRAR